MAAEPTAHHRARAAFVAEHRDTLEDYTNTDKRTAKIVEALLNWEREHSPPQEASQ